MPNHILTAALPYSPNRGDENRAAEAKTPKPAIKMQDGLDSLSGHGGEKEAMLQTGHGRLRMAAFDGDLGRWAAGSAGGVAKAAQAPMTAD